MITVMLYHAEGLVSCQLCVMSLIQKYTAVLGVCSVRGLTKIMQAGALHCVYSAVCVNRNQVELKLEMLLFFFYYHP